LIKKLIYISFLSVIIHLNLVGSDLSHPLEGVLIALFHTPVKVFISDGSINLSGKGIQVVTNCSLAVVEVGRGYCKRLPLIATDYSTFQKNPDSIATIYMDKGRIQLFFKEKGIKKFKLLLPKKYEGLVQ